MAPEIQRILTVLSVSAVTEELAKRVSKGKLNAPKRNRPSSPDRSVIPISGETVHGESD